MAGWTMCWTKKIQNKEWGREIHKRKSDNHSYSKRYKWAEYYITYVASEDELPMEEKEQRTIVRFLYPLCTISHRSRQNRGPVQRMRWSWKQIEFKRYDRKDWKDILQKYGKNFENRITEGEGYW